MFFEQVVAGGVFRGLLRRRPLAAGVTLGSNRLALCSPSTHVAMEVGMRQRVILVLGTVIGAAACADSARLAAPRPNAATPSLAMA